MTNTPIGAWIVWWKQTPQAATEKVKVIGHITEAIRIRQDHDDAYEAGMYTTKVPEEGDDG